MSLAYSDTTNLDGILQFIERELGFDSGYITGNTTRLKEWTAEVNLTHDDALALIFKAGGTWQFDDSNHTDYPIITANLVASQRDYSFTADENGNLILDIHRVMVADSSGKFYDLDPVDQQTPKSDTDGFVNGQNVTGAPKYYDKTANGILLDPIPNYNYSNGIKLFINREGSYFTTSDTTKKPGIAGLFHEYYVVSPAHRYASRKSMPNEASLMNRKIILEQAMRNYYGRRERDVPRRIIPNIESSR